MPQTFHSVFRTLCLMSIVTSAQGLKISSYSLFSSVSTIWTILQMVQTSTVTLALDSLLLCLSFLNLKTKMPSYTTCFKVWVLHSSWKRKFTIVTPPRRNSSFIKDQGFQLKGRDLAGGFQMGRCYSRSCWVRTSWVYLKPHLEACCVWWHLSLQVESRVIRRLATAKAVVGTPKVNGSGSDLSDSVTSMWWWPRLFICKTSGTNVLGLPWWLRNKESTCNARDAGSVPGSRRSPGEGSNNPLQYSLTLNFLVCIGV